MIRREALNSDGWVEYDIIPRLSRSPQLDDWTPRPDRSAWFDAGELEELRRRPAASAGKLLLASAVISALAIRGVLAMGLDIWRLLGG